jgi:hypothetical protein
LKELSTNDILNRKANTDESMTKTLTGPFLQAVPESQDEFIQRGLKSRDEAARFGEYYSAEEVLMELDDLVPSTKSDVSGGAHRN